ncbi:MAG: hypothetical protein M3016_06775 [Actinomycetota bacterium]|nr:hypothetical protein [Actinomycetota bacterium]
MRAAAAAVIGLACAACGSAGHTAPARAARPAGLLRWPVYRHELRPLDLAGPTGNGTLVLAAGGRLFTLDRSGQTSLFSAAYDRPGNTEPYIAAPAPGHRGCSFGRHAVYALRLYGSRGVVKVIRHGPVRQFARLTAPGLINGIAFDETGRFGHRLLVTINAGLRTMVVAIGCRGRVRTVTRDAPRVEGGIAVAPARFGRFGGQLVAPDEKSGKIYAIGRRGRVTLLVRSGLSFGQDVGVESEVFVPRRAPRYQVLGADRRSPGNPHPGDDALLRIGSAALGRAGVRPGDLLIGTEGGARLIAVRCRSVCRAHEVAAGPAGAHLEGHLGLLP